MGTVVVLPKSCPALKADQLESKSCCWWVRTLSVQKQSFLFQDFTPLHFVPAGNTSQPVFVSLIKRIWHWRYMLCVRYQMKVAKEWMKATKCCSATLCIIWERSQLQTEEQTSLPQTLGVAAINSMNWNMLWFPLTEQSSFEGKQLPY